MICRASRNGPAAPVLGKPLFLNVKVKFHFYEKQVINKSASVIFGFVSFIILSYSYRQKKHIKKFKVVGYPSVMLTW